MDILTLLALAFVIGGIYLGIQMCYRARGQNGAMNPFCTVVR